MFSSIGWTEIFFIVVLGLIIIGPERLPGVIQDVRAAVYAARKAINNAKAELNGEFGELGQEFEALRGPINAAAEFGRMSPKAALTKVIFDGDDSAWDDFNLKKAMEQKPADAAQAPPAAQAAQAQAAGEQQVPGAAKPTQSTQSTQSTQFTQPAQSTGGFDYSQIYSAPVPPAAPAQPTAQEPVEKRAGEGQTASSSKDGEPGQRGGFTWTDVT